MSKLTESPEDLATVVELVGWPKKIDDWDFDLKMLPKSSSELQMKVRYRNSKWKDIAKFPTQNKAKQFYNTMKKKSDEDLLTLFKMKK